MQKILFKSLLVSFFTLVFIHLVSPSLFASENNSEHISWFFLVIGLFGGLAFFLYGMEKMSDGMKQTAGNQMRSILGTLTQNRVVALFVGAFVTMVIQSSSATTVMLVSFVHAGLMSFVQSLGVILGADIGTTVTAQLIAFKLTDYALLMVALGFGMRMFARNDNIKNIGDVVLGFGILFYGMKLMSDSMIPLRSYDEFIDLMKGLENPLVGLVIGLVFTALIQSSSAFTGIIIVLAQQGLITLEGGISLILGCNIGTCVTAGLASIGTTREAKRVALAHVLFKVTGVIIFVFWIPAFAEIIRSISGAFDSGPARQIANAHTIFNVSLGLCFLPFTPIFAKLITKIIPDKEDKKGLVFRTRHIEDFPLSTPALSIDLARAEVARMANLLQRMMRAIIVPFMSDEKWINKEKFSKEEIELLVNEIPRKDEYFPQLSLIEGIDMREDKIDFLEEKVRIYLLRILKGGLSDQETSEVFGMISITNDIESVGDLIHRNMIPLIEKKNALENDFSIDGKEEIMIYHEKVCRHISLLKQAFSERDLEKAREIMAAERIFLDLELKYRIKHLERLIHKKRSSIETHEVHMELMDLMKQIVVYTSNIAKTFLTSCVEKTHVK